MFAAQQEDLSPVVIQHPTKRGWLTKQGRKRHSWKKRWFVLQDDVLYYFQTQVTDSKSHKPKGMLRLNSNCSVDDASGKVDKAFCIELYTPGRILYMYAESQVQMDNWMRALGQAIDPDASGAEKQHSLIITDMHCRRCGEHLVDACKMIPGASTVHVDTDLKRLTVSGSLLMSAVTDAVEAEGFNHKPG